MAPGAGRKVEDVRQTAQEGVHHTAAVSLNVHCWTNYAQYPSGVPGLRVYG
ncbi:hypothetical protein ACIRD2_06490 [Streptomyces sp. NPDC093595]|uniref:hypothetical protein n=1 Tax=Streptomyces sp. NPDC093595 TaxID=3366045 RepID=UPI00382F2FBD